MDEDTLFPGREKEVALLLKLFGEVGFRLFSCILDYFSFGKSYVCLILELGGGFCSSYLD